MMAVLLSVFHDGLNKNEIRAHHFLAGDINQSLSPTGYCNAHPLATTRLCPFVPAYPTDRLINHPYQTKLVLIRTPTL